MMDLMEGSHSMSTPRKGGAGMLVGRGNIWGRAAGQRGQTCGGRHLTSDGAGHPGDFVGKASKDGVNDV